jgi:hypothetical protein
MIKRDIGGLFICFSLVLGMTRLSFADSAEVLPKGIFRVESENNFYIPITQRYDPDGNLEDLAVDLNANLNSSVFPVLGLVEAGFGLPAGSANLGRSVVDFEYNLFDFVFHFQYGLTDRLTLGIEVPYLYNGNTVEAELNTSNATVGKNAALNTIAPLAVPGTVPLTTDDVQNLIGDGLDINGDGTVDTPGFGFKRVESRNKSGFSDIEAGFRYQYFKNRDWRLAFTGGVRFPTGEVDDPDDLVDIPFGTGAYAILFRLNQDFVISNLWKKNATPVKVASAALDSGSRNTLFQSDVAKSEQVPGPFSSEQVKVAKSEEVPGLSPLGDLTLNFTFKYDLVLPHHQTKRVTDPNNPVATDKERVRINIGDIFEFETSANYTFLKGLSFFGLHRYLFKLKNRVSGDRGFNYDALEKETKLTSHIFKVGLSYTTLPLFLEKKFPVPLVGTILYRNRFAGSNNALKSQYIGLNLSVLF